MSADTTPCADCGMPCTPREYHPYAACLMFKACHNSDTVRANLTTARAPAAAPQGRTLAEFVLQALLAAGHVTQEKVDAAMRLPGAPAASGKPVAWMHEEDPRRVISDAQREAARRDGGASWTSVRAYTVPLVRRP